MIYTLPIPPSLNNLFPGKAHRYISQEYNAWRKEAGRILMAQGGVRPVLGPVCVTIIVADHGRKDLDNLIKPILDFCVHHGAIEGDSRKTLRELRVKWADIVGVRIEITSVPDWIARKVSQRAAA